MDKKRFLTSNKKKGFTLIELLVVVAIIGILASIGVIYYDGYTKSTKTMVCSTQHDNVKKYINLSLTKCELNQKLIMKYSYSMATGQLTYTGDLCPLVTQNKVSTFANHIWAHFNAPPDCNCYGLKHSNGSCQQAVASGGTIGNGKLGETQIFSIGDEMIIDTKVSDNKVLNDKFKLK